MGWSWQGAIGLCLRASGGALTDDDILAIRGTVFHQLLAALQLPPEQERDAKRAVDISPDLPLILRAMGVKRDVGRAIEAALIV